MTFRNDVSIDWSVSPRIVTVASPSTEINVQDLYDTCMTLESQTTAIDDLHIIDAAGKEELGGGTSVGLTATFLNALLAFDARSGPQYIQCSVSGGNLVALESDLVTYTTTPISPTAFTQVVVTAASSATISETAPEDTAVAVWAYDPTLATGTTMGAVQRHSGFDAHVHLDVNNGSAGTTYPIGTVLSPVDNIADAAIIAAFEGLHDVVVSEDVIILATDNVDGLTIHGAHAIKSEITIAAGASTQLTRFFNCALTGTLNGRITVRDSIASDIFNFEGILHQTALDGDIVLSSTVNARTLILDCHTGKEGTTPPVINFDDNGHKLIVEGFHGNLELINKSQSEDARIGFNSGKLTLPISVSAGHIIVEGTATVDDNHTGTATVDIDGLGTTVSKGTIDVAPIFNEDITPYLTSGTFGEWLNNKGLTALKFMGLK